MLIVCGKGEEVHGVRRTSPAAGFRHRSGLVGHSAFNLNSALKQLALGGESLEGLRFGIITLAGRVVRHARTLIIRLGRGHPSYHLLLRARRRILHWLTDRPDRSLTFPTTNHHSKATQPSRPVLAMPSRLASSTSA